jgi:hypothetical protein
LPPRYSPEMVTFEPSKRRSRRTQWIYRQPCRSNAVHFLGLDHFQHDSSVQDHQVVLSAFTGTTLLGVAATLASIGLGSWYMLREK